MPEALIKDLQALLMKMDDLLHECVVISCFLDLTLVGQGLKLRNLEIHEVHALAEDNFLENLPHLGEILLVPCEELVCLI